MQSIDYSFIGFLTLCVLGLSSFIVYLVKKIINLTKDCHEAMRDVKNAVTNNTKAYEDNASAIRELRTTIITIKN